MKNNKIELIDFKLDTNEGVREYSQALHNRFNHSREQIDDSLVHIVLGSTILIVGLLFFFLSFKVDQETFMKVLKITCTEFWVSMVGIVVGGGLLIAGLIRFFFQKFGVQRPVLRSIRSIQNGTYDNLSEEDKQKSIYLASLKIKK